MRPSTSTRARGLLFTLTASLGTAVLASGAMADGEGGPSPDGHAPAGVMVDHMHKAGEFMVGYRFMYSRQDGDMLHGTDAVSDQEVISKACGTHGHGCAMKPDEMVMKMHMLDIMYAPTDWLTLMVMPQWMSMDMTMSPLEGAHGDDHHAGHGHDVSGFGDTTFGALVQLWEAPGHHLHAGLNFSAPTGSVDEKGSDGNFLHYGMQLGSGTWDFLPSLTYTGHADGWSWGAQLSGVKRLDKQNDSGFAFGDIFQATAWTGYRLTHWLSASVRVVYTEQGEIEGHFAGGHNHHSPPDLQPNYGGRFWDVGFGINAVVPDGALKGHRLSVEWLEPVQDDVNGYQLERDGTLFVSWSKAF